MKPFYKKISLFLIYIISGCIIGYFYIVPFVINHIYVPHLAYKSISFFEEIQNENNLDNDYSYHDSLGNKIIIYEFRNNILDIEHSFFKENLTAEWFYESTDTKKDKFEFKIVTFKQIDSLQYNLRVRKIKLEDSELISNKAKFLNYYLELEMNDDKLKIKKCNIINEELD